MKKIPEDFTLTRLFGALEKVRSDDRATILVACGYLELLTHILVTKHCKNSKAIAKDSRSYPFAARLLILNELGLIDDDLFAMVDEFRKIRNQAAHDAFFEFDAAAYVKRFEFGDSTPCDLQDLAGLLCYFFWSRHKETFGYDIK